MNRFDEANSAIVLGGNAHPIADFLVAGAQQVATPLRTLVILALALFGPIVAMYWATLVTGPGVADAVRWPGAIAFGPGGIALALLAGLYWPRKWAVVVEHLEKGYKVLPSVSQAEAEATARSINQVIDTAR